MKSLGQVELRELGLLYRQAAADLSSARADHASRSLEQYLNRLVGRAHNYVYSGNRVSAAGLWQFLLHGYPRVLRRLWPYVAASAAILIFSGLVGAAMAKVDPGWAAQRLGPAMMNTIENHHMWTDSILSAKPQASSAIMTNNIFVCFMTFATGIAAGLGTLRLLLQNGFSIGLIASVCAQHGLSLSLWSFVASHGALELPAIAFSGAAGLRLGTGILFPGMLRRRDAIALAGSEAVQLVSGTIPMLIVAGLFEAFLSPTNAPIAVKFAVCAFLFTCLCLWLGEGGRKRVDDGVRTEAPVLT